MRQGNAALSAVVPSDLDLAGKLVRVRTASDRTGIPLRTLYHWIKKDRLWSIQIDGHIFVRIDDIVLLIVNAGLDE